MLERLREKIMKCIKSQKQQNCEVIQFQFLWQNAFRPPLKIIYELIQIYDNIIKKLSH